MTTRAIVPNGDGEGSLGTSTAKWGAVYSSDPASGENSGQVPTTAWVQKLLADALAKQKAAYEQAISTAVSAAQTKAKLDAHPVGSYYWSNDSTSPATLFGGKWEALPAGYTLIAQGSGTDNYGSFTYTAGQKYGERKHQLTTEELPSPLNHIKYSDDAKFHPIWESDPNIESVIVDRHLTSASLAHENLSPSMAAYVWRRTA